MRLSGKRAIVTGGGRGIGRAIALGLARDGADVAIWYAARGELAEETAENVRSLGRRGLAIQVDVARSAEIESGLSRVLETLGGAEVLINNAGTLTRRPFLELPEHEWERVLEVDLKGPFLVSQHVARWMVEHEVRGSIISIASISAERAYPGLVHYQAAKAGVAMLTRGMALELAPYGIRVNAIAPGLTETDINRENLADPAVRADRVGRIPLGRPGQPEDHVGAAVFLASDESSWVTGTVITVDGGQTVR